MLLIAEVVVQVVVQVVVIIVQVVVRVVAHFSVFVVTFFLFCTKEDVAISAF